MIPIILLLIALLAALSLLPAFYYRRVPGARLWPRLYYIALLGGIVLGIFCASYQYESANYTRRYLGYPLPYVIFQLEEGHWVDYVPGAAGLFMGWGGNFLCATALLASPFTFYCLAASVFSLHPSPTEPST